MKCGCLGCNSTRCLHCMRDPPSSRSKHPFQQTSSKGLDSLLHVICECDAMDFILFRRRTDDVNFLCFFLLSSFSRLFSIELASTCCSMKIRRRHWTPAHCTRVVTCWVAETRHDKINETHYEYVVRFMFLLVAHKSVCFAHGYRCKWKEK